MRALARRGRLPFTIRPDQTGRNFLIVASKCLYESMLVAFVVWRSTWPSGGSALRHRTGTVRSRLQVKKRASLPIIDTEVAS